MKSWIAHNLHSLKIALARLRVAPFAALFTILVIGIALSLPAGLYVTLSNLHHVADRIKPQAGITVFLKEDVDSVEGRELSRRLARQPNIESARFIDRDAALRELQAGGLGDLAAGLSDNPLPHALMVVPKEATPDALEGVSRDLQKLEQVDRINLDAAWVKRLAAFMRLGYDMVSMLALLLGLALAAITGNTIRLQIYAQQEEIEVARLIGATDRFIRRPFLYFGGIQGLAGGLAAWGVIALAVGALQGSVSNLAASYGSQFLMTGLGWTEVGLLLASSTLLGLAGAYLAVGHTLRSLESF